MERRSSDAGEGGGPRGYGTTAMQESAPDAGGSSRLASAEMHPGPGFRVLDVPSRPAAEVVEGLGAAPTAMISDRLNRLYTMAPAIRLLTTASRLAGPAVTVKVFPGDNLMVHKALDLVEPGDVIVIDAAGSQMTAVIGDMVATKARHRGAVGIVVDGLVRDLEGIEDLGDFVVFGRGSTPIGPLHRGPGEVNVPVSCGGIVVSPGDVIVGDPDGVVVVPQSLAADLVEVVTDDVARDQAYGDAVRRGEFSMAWVDEALEQSGLTLRRPGSPPTPH